MQMRRRYRIGVPGLLFLALVIVIGVAAGSRAGNLLVWVFSAMVAWILVSGVVSGAMLMGLVAGSASGTSPALGPAVTTALAGLLAGWTTYSAFSMDVVQLWLRGARGNACVLWAATLLGAPAAALAGGAIARAAIGGAP